MNSREKILADVAENQPERFPLPDVHHFERNAPGSLEKFSEILSSIGGQLYHVSGYGEIAGMLTNRHGTQGRITTPIPQLASFYKEIGLVNNDVHGLHNVEVAILKARFGVAENGAVWITQQEMGERVLPFICQHLVVIIDAGAIVPTMHEAYELISKTSYDYATFIAGPSKTADIEQSLVIGAHGPRSMTIFVLNEKNEAYS